MCENCAGKRGKFYVTTPIYYPSDNLHIGHAYCTDGDRYAGALQAPAGI